MPSNRKGHSVQVVRFPPVYPFGAWRLVGNQRTLRQAMKIAGDYRKEGKEVRVLDPDRTVIAHWPAA